MKRMQIQLDEETYELVRNRAYQRGVSISSVLREAAREYIVGKQSRPRTLADFPWIGMAKVEDTGPLAVSENHDEVLADLLYEEIQEKAEEFQQRHPEYYAQ